LITRPVRAIEIQQFSPESISMRDQHPSDPLSTYLTKVAIEMSEKFFQTNVIGHARRTGKVEFQLGRCPPSYAPACSC
jgi:hypothetical protein